MREISAYECIHKDMYAVLWNVSMITSLREFVILEEYPSQTNRLKLGTRAFVTPQRASVTLNAAL